MNRKPITKSFWSHRQSLYGPILRVLCVFLLTGANAFTHAQEPAQPLPSEHVIFLGTGAADVDLPLRHKDANCTYVREHGGRNIRRNASLFVPPNLIIDYSKKGREGLKATGIEPSSVDFILITHSHGDHFDPRSIADLATEKKGHLVLCGDAKVVAAMGKYLDGVTDKPDIELRELKAEKEFELGEFKVKPLAANHTPGEEALIYVLRHHGRSFLYATDTSWLPANSFQALRSEKLELVIIECTFGDKEIPDLLTAHMNLTFVRIFQRWVLERGILKNSDKFAVTHLSLHWCDPHDIFEPKLAAEHIILPFDGLRLDY